MADFAEMEVPNETILKGVLAGLIERKADAWVLTELGDRLFLEFLEERKDA